MINKLLFFVQLVVVIAIVALSANAYMLKRDLFELQSNIERARNLNGFVDQTEARESTTPNEVLGEISDLRTYVDSAVATVSALKSSATPKPTISPATAAPIAKTTQTTFIPLSGGFSTKSTEWTDVPGAQIWIDLSNDFGPGAKVVWDAFIREEHGNGNAYVRLYDATHNIEVSGSAIGANSQTSTLVTSGNIGLWAGKNLYKVQIRSEKSFYVFFDSGRIKITY